MNTYLVDVTLRVRAEDEEGAFDLVSQRAQLAFDEAVVFVSEPDREISSLPESGALMPAK